MTTIPWLVKQKTLSKANGPVSKAITKISASPAPIPNRRRGDLLRLPDTTISYAVRQAMEKTKDKVTGAKLAGVSDYTYDFVRKLIILSEDDRLSLDRRTVLRGALRKIDADKQIKDARIIAGDIVNEFWARRTMGGVTEQQKISNRKRKKIFENVLFHIREACDNNEEIEIPNNLRQEDRMQAVDTLVKSIEHISAMVRKINNPSRKGNEAGHDKSSGLQSSGHSGEEPVSGMGKVPETFQ